MRATIARSSSATANNAVGAGLHRMRRFARAVAGMPGVETVIYSGVGLWLADGGWSEIRSETTYRDHVNHVHVDTFA